VLRILTLTGANQLVPIYPILEAALAGTPAQATRDPAMNQTRPQPAAIRKPKPPPTGVQHRGDVAQDAQGLGGGPVVQHEG
jgi:hypothetical protein